MYNAQQTIERVQSEIREKKKTQKHILEICGLNENTLKKMTDKNGIASFSLAKIADELDCSVDYLLGRTDNPIAHKAQNLAISNHDTIINGTQANVINGEPVDTEVLELAQLIKSLPLVKRAEAILAVEEIKNGGTL